MGASLEGGSETFGLEEIPLITGLGLLLGSEGSGVLSAGHFAGGEAGEQSGDDGHDDGGDTEDLTEESLG